MKPASLVAIIATLCASAATAQSFETRFRPLRPVALRTALQIRNANLTNTFSIGAETTDRGYSSYTSWIDKIGPLGAQRARAQSGWADIERSNGVFTYTKLDAIVDGMRAVGVQPWVDLVYGNALFTGGGTATGKPIPTGVGTVGGRPLGRTAWIRYVDNMALHYAGRVDEWEIWNEPELVDGQIDPTDFGTFLFDTATAIRIRQPNARVYMGGFAGINAANRTYMKTAFDRFEALRTAVPTGASGYIAKADVYVSYHPYNNNPDSFYTNGIWNNFTAFIAGYGYKLRMGENGAPSVDGDGWALSGGGWNAGDQERFLMRRMLADFHRGIVSNIFTIIDLHYPGTLNNKGLMTTQSYVANSPPTNGNQAFKAYKPSYRVYQNVTAIFDNRLVPVPAATAGCTTPTPGYTIQAYTRNDAGVIRNLMAVWRSNARPGADESAATITITCTGFTFPRFAANPGLLPRYTDLLTGMVYETLVQAGPPQTVVPNGAGVTVNNIRVTDYPVVLADQGIVLF